MCNLDKHTKEVNEERNMSRNEIKVGFGKFSFSMSGDFVKENGKLLTIGTVGCGVIATAGLTFCAVYTTIKNPQKVTNIATKFLKVTPKIA